MQKWEYAELFSQWDKDDSRRSYYVRFIGSTSSRFETPPKVKKGSKEVLPPDEDCCHPYRLM